MIAFRQFKNSSGLLQSDGGWTNHPFRIELKHDRPLLGLRLHLESSRVSIDINPRSYGGHLQCLKNCKIFNVVAKVTLVPAFFSLDFRLVWKSFLYSILLR